MNQVHPIPPESDSAADGLDVLSLELLPVTHLSLRKARLVKNVRLDSVIELYRDAEGGRGGYSVTEIGATLGIAATHPDLLLLRYLARLPSFDTFTVRLLLRELDTPEDKLPPMRIGSIPAARFAQSLTRLTAPMLTAAYGSAAGVSVQDLRSALARGDQTDPAVTALCRAVDLGPAATARFAADHLDTLSALALYAETAASLTPWVENLQSTIKQLASEPRIKTDQSLVANLASVVQTIPGVLGAAMKRLASREKIVSALWTDSGSMRTRRHDLIEFQVLTGGLVCGVAAKLYAWRSRMAGKDRTVPQKLAQFVAGELAHGLPKLRELAVQGLRGAATPAAARREEGLRGLLRELDPRA